jgi:hypothetical protein
MTARAEVLIHFSPGLIELSAIHNGRVVDAGVTFLPMKQGDSVVAAARALHEPLSTLVAQTGMHNARAHVWFTSPLAGAGVFSCHQRAGVSAAARAAILALGESLSADLTEQPHATFPLFTDKDSKAAPPHSHTLAVTAPDTELTALANLVEGAGLKFADATPSMAVELLSAVREALRVAKDGPVVVLYLGTQCATIIGAVPNRLRFVRQAPIGLDTFLDALVREPVADVNGVPHTLTRNAARDILMKNGIPQAGQPVEIRPGVQSAALLPILQSALQRLVVEVKQSSRFGLDEAERSAASLHVVGRGACVPRLGDLVASLTGLSLANAPASGSPKQSTTSSDFSNWASAAALHLAPLDQMRDRLVATLKRSTLVGLAAALAIMATSWGLTRWELRRITSEITNLSTPHASTDQANSLAERVRVADVFLASARDSLHVTVTSRARVEGLLLALGQASSNSLYITEMRFDPTDAALVAKVVGEVEAGSSHDAAAVIGRFIDSVSATPVVRSCKLTSTRKGGTDGQSTLFDLSIELVRLPGSSLATFDQPAKEQP